MTATYDTRPIPDGSRLDDLEAIRRIHAILDMPDQWHSETIERVAAVVVAAGWSVTDEPGDPADHAVPPLVTALDHDEDGLPICPRCEGTRWRHVEEVSEMRLLRSVHRSLDGSPGMTLVIDTPDEYADEGLDPRLVCSACVFRVDITDASGRLPDTVDIDWR